ncbi:MAG: sulfatase-like hydrolase/transferase [Tissierellia bacterium]|nr:sulfatase-like hydrolase/transferase [Tissierellia bacterium]
MRLGFKRWFSKIKLNIMPISFIAGAVINDLILRKMTVGNVIHWKPILTSIAMIILMSILVLFLPYHRRNRGYMGLSIFCGILNGLNYLYYGHYNSFLSFSLITQLTHLRDVGDSIIKSLDLRVFIFAIPPVILLMIIKKLKKIDYFIRMDTPNRRREFMRPLVTAIALLSVVSITLTSTDKSRIVKQWNRPYLVEQLGIYSYTAADFIKNVASINVHQVEEAEASGMMEDLVGGNIRSRDENEYKGIFQGRDVYIIHYESAQTFAMDLEFADGPVTPFLNRMASEGLHFSNFYPQHSVGTSSDSEFTFNTSLLPINNGTVFMTHTNREYQTLQKLLKGEGYYSISMHGNNGDFWNRNIMHRTLGYDRFFSKGDYMIDEEIGLGLSDASFFRQSIDKIGRLKDERDQPIVATLITLTNHHPFDEVDSYGEFNVGYLEGTDIGNYLKSYHYADRALESFIKGMDNEGLLDNAIVVLYGDHHATIANGDYEKLYNYNEHTGSYYSKDDPQYADIGGAFLKQLRRTPFIIWSKDQAIRKNIDTPMGMLDVLPTLGNMLGVFNPYQMGVDMMSVDTNRVIFANGDWINEDFYYLVALSELYDIDTNEIVEDVDVSIINESVEKRIELSNNIIENDLIKLFNSFLTKSDGDGPM